MKNGYDLTLIVERDASMERGQHRSTRFQRSWRPQRQLWRLKEHYGASLLVAEFTPVPVSTTPNQLQKFLAEEYGIHEIPVCSDFLEATATILVVALDQDEDEISAAESLPSSADEAALVLYQLYPQH